MNFSFLENNDRIEKIECASLPGKRYRPTGKNSVRHEQGDSVPFDIVRVTIAGKNGFGWSVLTKESAEALIGKPVSELITPEGRVRPEFQIIDFPMIDWLGQAAGQPVYAMYAAGKNTNTPGPFKVGCYDTSLYFDEIHLKDERAAVQLIQGEVNEGKEKGHRSFKIKIGRGGRHMPLDEGIARDIAVIRGVRETAGPDARIMIDANNAYNLNLAKRLLSEIAGERVYWFEEPFYESDALYEDLKEWLAARDMNVLIADGEGYAAQPLVEWAKKGYIDVVQYDIRTYGFTRWLELGPVLDGVGVKSAPHNYHSAYGNYASGHLASGIEGFQMVEWDEIAVTGLDASGYKIVDGQVIVPDSPGFGLFLDENYFARMVKENGWSLTL